MDGTSSQVVLYLHMAVRLVSIHGVEQSQKKSSPQGSLSRRGVVDPRRRGGERPVPNLLLQAGVDEGKRIPRLPFGRELHRQEHGNSYFEMMYDMYLVIVRPHHVLTMSPFDIPPQVRQKAAPERRRGEHASYEQMNCLDTPESVRV